MTEHILVIEDDQQIADLLRRGLIYEGYSVKVAGDGPDGLAAARDRAPDLVLLDLMLPGMDGLTVCQRLRAASDVPILILTAKDAVPDRVKGLDAGADDYLVKPFDFDELLARIRALLRRRQPVVQEEVLRFADMTLNPMTHEVYRGSRRVDFCTKVEWQETHKMLKVNFPVNFHTTEAIHEIQFGHIRRPNHRSRQYDADRFEVSAHKWSALAEENGGFAVLNDSKYGVGVNRNSINLTLLKSANGPDMTADKGTQVFTYAFYAWNGSFVENDLVREGYDLNVPVITAPGSAGEGSLFSLDAANIIIDTVKPAEDGSGDIVVRMYESKRAATTCKFNTTLPVKSAVETNMLEEEQAKLDMNAGVIPLQFRAFEVKTIRLKP